MKKARLFIIMCFVIFYLMNISYSQEKSDNILEIKAIRIEEEFLGLHLGSDYQEASDILHKGTSDISFFDVKNEGCFRKYVYTGNHKLKGAMGTVLTFWDNKLQAIVVLFQGEDAEQVYDALKIKVEKKYGKMTDSIAFMGKEATLNKGSMQIYMQYEENFGEGKQTIFGAVHLGLLAKQKSSEIEKKADKLGDI